MGIPRQLQLVLAFGALTTASWIAKTSIEDDNDTPLPLVIWHGKWLCIRPAAFLSHPEY